MTLQLPGLSYGSGEPTTVEVDFLDSADTLVYTLKGEVFIKTYPLQANSLFIPDKITGTQKYVKKLRIRAGESGMVLKVFDSPTASVPKLMLLMKAGYVMANNQPIEIDFMGGDDHQTIQQAEINWYNRDLLQMQKQGGMHIGKLELHVERTENAPLQPVFKFGAMSTPQSSLLLPDAISGVNGISVLPSPNAVYMAPPQGSSPNVYFNVAPPQLYPPQGQQQQQLFPNAQPFLSAA